MLRRPKVRNDHRGQLSGVLARGDRCRPRFRCSGPSGPYAPGRGCPRDAMVLSLVRGCEARHRRARWGGDQRGNHGDSWAERESGAVSHAVSSFARTSSGSGDPGTLDCVDEAKASGWVRRDEVHRRGTVEQAREPLGHPDRLRRRFVRG